MKKQGLFVALSLTVCFLHAQEALRVTNGATLAVTNGATLTVAGGVTLSNGSKLVNNGTITLARNAGAADWTDNSSATYTYGSGKVVFNSAGAQTLKSIDSFRRIEVDNGGLQLASDITSAQWYLTAGMITTGDFKVITTGAIDSAVQAAPSNKDFANSWISGSLRRNFDAASVDRYTFPVGPSGTTNQVVMDNLKASPLAGVHYIDVSFAPKPGNDAGLIVREGNAGFTALNPGGVWYITPDQQPSSGTYDLILYFDNFTGLADNSFAILRRPDSSTSAADWTVPVGSKLPEDGSPGRTVASGYARRNNISTFSQFGIGMTSIPLPITLLGFQAHRLDHTQVALEWTTGMESNNKGFDIEQHNDNDSTFHFRGFVSSEAPNGNSSTSLSYHYTDANDYRGISYYRLKQTDLDGHYIYTSIRAVSGSGTGADRSVLLFPNPNHGLFTIRMEGNTAVHPVRIIDAKGAVVRTLVLSGSSDLPVSGLRAGSYIVQVIDAFGPGQSFTEKVLVMP